MTTRLPSYPKVFALGHPSIADLLKGPVVVEEKLDGSQISFAWTRDEGLIVRSKGKTQYGPEGTLDGMFVKAVDYLQTVEPVYGYVFRAEYFTKPKHNTLAYDVAPANGLALFDAEAIDAPSSFWDRPTMERLAAQLGIGIVRDFTRELAEQVGSIDQEDGTPILLGELLDLPTLTVLMQQESQLGGPKIEGVVVKNYNRFTPDGKVMMGKVVSDDFKERHSRDWKTRNPNRADILEDLTAALNTEARWRKAVQHLREDGVLTGTPADIGNLMREVKRDTMDEERAWILEKLAAYFLPKIERTIGRGLPEWFKAELAAGAFDDA